MPQKLWNFPVWLVGTGPIPGPVEPLVFIGESSCACSDHCSAEMMMRTPCRYPQLCHCKIFSSPMLSSLSSCLLGPPYSQLCLSTIWIHQASSDFPITPHPQPWPRNSLKAISWDNCTAHIFPPQLSGGIILCCLMSSILKNIISYNFPILFVVSDGRFGEK